MIFSIHKKSAVLQNNSIIGGLYFTPCIDFLKLSPNVVVTADSRHHFEKWWWNWWWV